MAALPSSLTPALPEADGARQELLELLARQGRRVPYPVGISVLTIAVMAGDTVGPWYTGAWLLLAFGVLALRWWALGRLPRLNHLSVQRRLDWAVGLSALNGLVFCLSMLFCPFLSDYERMVQTILLLGLCAGAVATTAGYGPVFLAFLVPVSLANAVSWVLVDGTHELSWIEWVLSGLILGFAAVLTGLARDAWRVFVESINIRQQQALSNEQLRLALHRAELAIASKTRFLASASHDLRQPMHTLSLLGAALTRRPLEAPSAEIARQMNAALRSLASQMDALLDISKLDAQVVEVSPEVFSLSGWLRRLQQEFLPAAQSKQLDLTLDCPAGAHVETDPVLLERVVRNLIDNAIKYTQDGDIGIKASRDGELWKVAICDTGIGIAAEDQARVFDEFYQVGNPERNRAKGLGLGLSIVSRLVDLLDLHLQMQSAPGVGSCFTLSIAAADVTRPPSQSEGQELERLQDLCVLVVDDEEPVRLAMEALLGAYGCEVLLAGSTREALVKSLGRRPDIVLADMRLRQGDDGLAAVRSLRSALPGLPAVLVSGDTAPERLREAHVAGLPLLHKPVAVEQLVATLLAALPGDGTRAS